jgi:transposase-like protein
MRLPLLVIVVTACFAVLLSAARAVGAALPRGMYSGCIVHFQRFALAQAQRILLGHTSRPEQRHAHREQACACH